VGVFAKPFSLYSEKHSTKYNVIVVVDIAVIVGLAPGARAALNQFQQVARSASYAESAISVTSLSFRKLWLRFVFLCFKKPKNIQKIRLADDA
jgi:hypothetical protein